MTPLCVIVVIRVSLDSVRGQLPYGVHSLTVALDFISNENSQVVFPVSRHTRIKQKFEYGTHRLHGKIRAVWNDFIACQYCIYKVSTTNPQHSGYLRRRLLFCVHEPSCSCCLHEALKSSRNVYKTFSFLFIMRLNLMRLLTSQY